MKARSVTMLGMTPYNDVRFGLLGGSIVDANALLRSYIWHCIGIPICGVDSDDCALLAGTERRRNFGPGAGDAGVGSKGAEEGDRESRAGSVSDTGL